MVDVDVADVLRRNDLFSEGRLTGEGQAAEDVQRWHLTQALGRGVGTRLKRVVQRRQVTLAVAALQGQADELVCQRRVFGQDRAVQVAAEGIAVARALVAA